MPQQLPGSYMWAQGRLCNSPRGLDLYGSSPAAMTYSSMLYEYTSAAGVVGCPPPPAPGRTAAWRRPPRAAWRPGGRRQGSPRQRRVPRSRVGPPAKRPAARWWPALATGHTAFSKRDSGYLCMISRYDDRTCWPHHGISQCGIPWLLSITTRLSGDAA